MPPTTAMSAPSLVVDVDTPALAAAQRLRNTLRLNASTSLLGGCVAALAPVTLDRALGAGEPAIVRWVGIGLVLFATGVLWLAGERIERLRSSSLAVVAADVSWLAGTATVISLGWLSASGRGILLAVAAMVAALATAQVRHWLSLRRLGGSLSLELLEQAPPTEIVHVRRRFDGDADAAWSVLTDPDLYARLALNLSVVSAPTAPEPGATRTCSDIRGREWRETFTAWDHGSRFEVSVDTDADDYPYPLTELRGSWWLDDSGRQIVLGMDFRIRPAPGLRGRAFVLLMQAAFPLVLRRITRG